MVLSAAAELHSHLDSSFCEVISKPVWENIRPDDVRSKASPLYPLTVGYGQPAPSAGPSAATSAAKSAELPTAGPSAKAKGKRKALPEEGDEDDRGRQLERPKRVRPRAMSTGSAAPKAKRPRNKSKS